MARGNGARFAPRLAARLVMTLPRKVRLLCWIAGPLVLLLALGLAAVYLALRHVPAFYQRAMVVDRATLERGSDELLKRTAALASDLKREGRWEMLLTAEQINGFLAVELPRNHPEALPPELHDPRVAIEPDCIRLGCTYDQGHGTRSVMSVVVQPYLEAPDRLALRIADARAGALPLPLAKLMRHVSAAAAREGFRLQWLRSDDDPLALVGLPELVADGHRVHVDQLRLGQGEIYLAGTSEKPRANPGPLLGGLPQRTGGQ